MQKRHFKNTLLDHLDSATVDRLQLKQVQLKLRQDLEIPGRLIPQLFFVEEGFASMTTVFKDGFEVEVGVFGYESAIGASALMGAKRSYNRIFMQLAGHGFSSAYAIAKAEFDRHGDFHDSTLRYVQAQLTQATQSIACNLHHSQVQRLARWILICSDSSNQVTLKLSQEFLAYMLGSARPTVTIGARKLKNLGLISYSRGILHILDRNGLEEAACECYHAIAGSSRRLR